MNFKIFVLLLIICTPLFAQEVKEKDAYIDSHYLEDQFYIGLQYSIDTFKSDGIDNIGVPFSIQAGFIKDIPLNKKRNNAIGIGLGYALDVVRPNIAITENNNNLTFNIDNSYSRYDYTSHSIEVPLEYRWRTSTPTNSSFWRVYSGVSFIYNIHNNISLEDNTANTTVFKDISELNKTNFTLYTSAGFGTWNLHLKYYINPHFKNNTRTETGEKFNFNQLKIGVMFYIL